jgi:hypothetical protein
MANTPERPRHYHTDGYWHAERDGDHATTPTETLSHRRAFVNFKFFPFQVFSFKCQNQTKGGGLTAASLCFHKTDRSRINNSEFLFYKSLDN